MLRLIRVSVAVVLFLMVARPVMAGSKADDLQPSDGMFSEPVSLDYYLALHGALLAEHGYRRCQMLTVPSFEPEWAVYLIRDGSGSAQVILKTFKTQLWLQMPYNRPNASGGGSSPRSAPISLPLVERTVAVVPQAAADLLEPVWATMLARVKYPKAMTLGTDGTTYYMSHWQWGVGVRSGKTWLPDAHSNAGSLVTIGTALREYALAGDDQRGGVEVRVRRDAASLLQRLENMR